jgi:hypothetical protein
LQRELRQTVREQGGHLLRQAPRRHPGQAGGVTVTGLLPSPGAESTALTCHHPAPSAIPRASALAAEQVISQLLCPTRSLLTLTGRPPWRLAGLETYERLHSVAGMRLALLATRYAPRLVHFEHGLQAALAPFAATSHALHQGATWLCDIADLLAPVSIPPLGTEDVAGPRRSSLALIQRQPAIPPA